jgi:hypothetical protein
LSSSARKSKSPPPPPSSKVASRERAAGGWEASQPEIRVAYAPAGRETLEAITAEIVGGGSERHDSLPEIQVREAPAGRETLAAIAEELRPAARAPLDTIPYADHIKNAPGAHTPSMTPALRRNAFETAPDLSVESAAVDGETLAAIEQEAQARESHSSPSSGDAPPTSGLNPIRRSAERAVAPEASNEPLEIFEMATFVVRGTDAARLSTDALRRRFVEERLMHRLPVETLDEIDRVDVTPWTVRGTFVVRVWCKVAGIDAVDIRAD